MARMIGDLVAYEMAGQRRCMYAPAGLMHHVGSGEECHVHLAIPHVPNVLFSFVRDGAGGMQILDAHGNLMEQTSLPFETEVVGMRFVMFEPDHLLEPPRVVDPSPACSLLLRAGDEATLLQVPPGCLLCAGWSRDADILLPAGPAFAYVLWWDGANGMHIA